MMSRTPEPGTPGTAPALSRPLPGTVSVVNVGLALLGDAVRAQQGEVVDVRWQIPALGKEALVGSLTSLFGRQAGRIDQPELPAALVLLQAGCQLGLHFLVGEVLIILFHHVVVH